MDRLAGLELKEKLGRRSEYFTINNSGHHIYADNFNSFNQIVVATLQNKQPRRNSNPQQFQNIEYEYHQD
jgi:hypothetical protein